VPWAQKWKANVLTARGDLPQKLQLRRRQGPVFGPTDRSEQGASGSAIIAVFLFSRDALPPEA